MADYATLVFDIDSSQADGAARALAGLNRYAAATATVSAKLERQFRSANGQFKSQIQHVAENEREIRSLAASYNPVLNAQLQFAERQKEVARAVQLGVIAADQQANVLRQLATQYDVAAGAAQRSGQMSRFASNNVRNLGFQLNDIAMMSLTGQSLFYLIPQQGLQIVQVMNDIKASGQGLGTAVAGAFRQMVNPMALVTLGAVGAAAAVVQFGASMFGASGDAKSFSDVVSDAEAAIDRINKASRALTSDGLEELRKKYGLVNDEVRRLVEQERILAIAAGAKALNAQISAITESLGDGVFNTAYSEIERIFKVGSNEAQVLYGVLGDIKNQGTIEAQLLSITTMRDRLSAVTNGFKNMTAEQADMLEKLTISESLIRQQQNTLRQTPSVIAASTAATESWARAMSGVLSYINAVGSSLSNISGGAIRLAAIKTETDLLRQGKTLREASLAATTKTAELEGARRTKELEAQYGWAGKILGIAEQNQRMSIINAEAQLDLEREAAREREKSSSGGGSGARELAQAKKQFQSLRELMEEDTLFQFAEYQKRQSQLDNALAQRLLSEQNYNLMRDQLQTLYFGTEYEKEGLQYLMKQQQLDAALEQQKISHERYNQEIAALNASQQVSMLEGWASVFGNVSSAISAGGDKANAAFKAFAVVNGLLNSYLAYTQVLADPSLIGRPFLRTALAASTLAAGLAQVANMKSSGGGGGSSASTATSAVRQEPERQVLVRLEGDEWLVNMADNIMTQIYEQSKDGRVIVARQY